MAQSEVTLIDSMGSDLTVCNAARVSFSKETFWEWDRDDVRILRDSDRRLIEFLARGCSEQELEDRLDSIMRAESPEEQEEKVLAIRRMPQHFAPFAHCMVSLRMKAPLFVARQLWKSHIGLASQDENLAWSEESRRYVDCAPEVHEVKHWRQRPANVKQGSCDMAAYPPQVHAGQYPDDGSFEVEEVETGLLRWYAEATSGPAPVAPELARTKLPQSVMVEWIWTGSLLAFARICRLRLDDHAQRETAEVAKQIEAIVEPLFPVSWAALKRY